MSVRSTQQKVRDRLSAFAETNGLEMVEDHDYANTGTWRFQRPDGLDDVVTVKFYFHHGYCGLLVVGVDPDNGPGVIGGGYITSKTIEEKVSAIELHILEREVGTPGRHVHTYIYDVQEKKTACECGLTLDDYEEH